MYRVLIVEDEDIIRKGIAYTMDWVGMGCTIVGEAVNGSEGLEKIKELSPDIVMADIMMPVMDGIEMIRAAKEDESLLSFKSIILTSYADFDYAKKAIDLDVSAYLMKPVDEEELSKAVSKITGELEKERTLEQITGKLGQIGEKTNVEAGIGVGNEGNGNDNTENAVKDALFLKTNKENDYIQHILDVTKERFQDKISIEMFSGELGVSASYLSRKFKESTGTSYLDFLNKYRVQQAVKLLETGTYKVYEVSDMTGFTDYKHFNTVFKRYTGVSPSEYMN